MSRWVAYSAYSSTYGHRELEFRKDSFQTTLPVYPQNLTQCVGLLRTRHRDTSTGSTAALEVAVRHVRSTTATVSQSRSEHPRGDSYRNRVNMVHQQRYGGALV